MRKRSEARPRERGEDAAREDRIAEFGFAVPNDPANEQVVIAAMLVADAETCDRLLARAPADAFYAKEHRVVRDVIAEARRQGLALDPATLSRLNPEVDVRIVERLPAARPDVPDNLAWHLDTLLWDWRRAQATRGPIAALLEAVQNPKEAPERVRAVARQVADAFEGATGRTRYLRDPEQVIGEAMTSLRKRAAGLSYFPFGIPGLDFDEEGNMRCRPGTAPGQITILTGMSGSGKTSIAAHMILGIARQRRRVLVGAWEVRAPMTLELLATISLGWSRSRVLDGRSNTARLDDDSGWARLTPGELDALEQRMREISKYVAFVDNPFRRGSVRTEGKVTNDDYLDVLQDHVEASGCEVVLLDLFDRCLRYRRPDEEQEALWRVVEMTDTLRIHSILVHQQLMKGDDVRADRRPSLAGLKGSSAYVDVGSIILAPHLPARWKSVPDDTLELMGLKLRYAPPFAVEFDWSPDTGQISGGRTFDAKDAVEAPDEAFGAPSARKTGRGFHTARGKTRRNGSA